MFLISNRQFLIVLFAVLSGICKADQYGAYQGYMTLGEYREMTKAEQGVYLVGLLDGVLSSDLLRGVAKERITKEIYACVTSHSKEQYVEKMQQVISSSYFADTESMQRFVLYLKTLCSESR